jgi:NADH-quinone oxidoreductase subunit A
MTDLVGHFLLFSVIGIVFLIAPLLLGKLIRPTNPSPQKLTAYECGEPAIGSAYIQFDLRFYVVALLFIIFDVEVAFFFPWAAIYGTAAHLADGRLETGAREALSARLLNLPTAELAGNVVTVDMARQLMVTGLVDILVFFGVLLVGFAYVWKRGDLDWVRAMTEQSRANRPLKGTAVAAKESRELQSVS